MIDSSDNSVGAVKLDDNHEYHDYHQNHSKVSFTVNLTQWCLVLAVAMLGIAGSIFSFDGKSEVYASFLDDYLSTNEYQKTPMLAEYPRNEKSVLFNSDLKIEGVAKTNYALTFSFLQFDKRDKMEIDFGNGSVAKVHQREMHYAYTDPGNYIVKLNTYGKSKKKSSVVGTLNIKESIPLYGQIRR